MNAFIKQCLHYYKQLIIISCVMLSACSQHAEKGIYDDQETLDKKAFIASLPKDPYWQQDYQTVAESFQQDFQLALNLYKNDELKKSERILIKLSKNFPELSSPFLQLAIIAADQQRQKESIVLAEKAIRKNPYNYAAYTFIAQQFRQQGRFIEAQDKYLALLSAWPGHGETYYNLAVLNDLYLGNKKQAYDYYHTYLLIAGSDKTVEAWLEDLKRQL